MIKDMYSVMQRINDIQNKFGLKKIYDTKQDESSKISYDKIHNKALKDVDRKFNVNNTSVENINKIADFYADKNEVPSSLVKSMIKIESGYNHKAISPKGAKGLMQLMPSIIKEMKVNDPFIPEDNIRAGTELVKKLLDDYNGDYKKALSAYNAGKGAVEKYNGVPDYKETKDYISKVIKSYLSNI